MEPSEAAKVAEPVWQSAQFVSAVVAALIAGGVAVWQTIRAERQKTNATAAAVLLQSGFEAQQKKRYGFGAAHAVAEVEVGDDGSARFIRRWEGLAVEPGVVLNGIPGKSVVDHGQVAEACTLTPPPNTFGKGVNLETVRAAPGATVVTYQVRITGGLTDKDPPLDFAVGSQASKSFGMSKQEVDAALPAHFRHEYAASSVDFPVARLAIRLRFSGKFRARAFPFVFLGYDGEVEYPNPTELQRVKGGFKNNDDNSGAEFVIESPLIGLLYLIYWDPPTV